MLHSYNELQLQVLYASLSLSPSLSLCLQLGTAIENCAKSFDLGCDRQAVNGATRRTLPGSVSAPSPYPPLSLSLYLILFFFFDFFSYFRVAPAASVRALCGA